MKKNSLKEFRKTRRETVRAHLLEKKMTQVEIAAAVGCGINLVSEVAKEIATENEK